MKIISVSALIAMFLFFSNYSASAQWKVLYTSTSKDIRLGVENLIVRKDAGSLKFKSITEMGSYPDLQLRFENPELNITTTVTVYKAPDDTKGPMVLFDKNDKPILDEENKNALFKKSEPSESYTKEFYRVVNYIEKISSLKYTTPTCKPLSFLSVPKDLKSPIAYTAYFTGSGEFKGEQFKDTMWVWSFRLYVKGKYFVKIHTDGPANTSFAGMPEDPWRMCTPEMLDAENSLIEAINWY